VKRAFAAVLVALACSASPHGSAGNAVTPQAAVLIEPPRLRVGDVASIEWWS